MYIARLAVRHWRGLEDLVLEDLSPGLTLISGPNESGKSRLVQALWYALFESSKGQSEAKKQLQSHGLGSEKPRVSLEFELAGQRWHVEKQFLGTGTNTALRGPQERLQGDEAERRLRELMRVAEPSNRGLKKEDAGIWPLLWVDQHQSAHAPTAETGDDARHQLQERLTVEVGEVAAGERGQALLQRARAQRNRFYTSGRGDETGPLRSAREELERSEAALSDALEARKSVAADADRLGEAREQENEFQERIQDAEQRLSEARQREESARRARERLTAAEHAEERARGLLEQAERRAEERNRAETELAERTRLVTQLEEDLEALNLRTDGVGTEAAQCNEAAEVAEARSEAARASLEALRQAERRYGAREALDTLRDRLATAREIREHIRAASGSLAALPDLNDSDVDALAELHDTLATAQARLEGAAVRLTLEATNPISIDGDEVTAGASRSWTIDNDRTLDITGIGKLRIEPGAGELATLRDECRDAASELDERLKALDVADVSAARATLAQRQDLERTLASQRSALQREAPEGFEALIANVREQERRLGLQPDVPLPDIEPVAAEAIDAAERADIDARGTRDDARARRDEAREHLQSLKTELAALAARMQAAQQEQAGKRALLDTLPSADTLQTAVKEARETLFAAGGYTAEARGAFESLGGTAAKDDVNRLEKSLSQLRTFHSTLGREISVLEDRLRAAGNEGRHETVQEWETEAAQARTELARIEEQARAAKRLFEVLDRAAREARERLAGPVVARIAPYLADLFPDNEVWLDEFMNLQGLRSEVAEARFEELSGGAKEQLALLVRIGLAEVLGADEPWPLVLDDALVNTDPARIERVQRMLFRASKNMQILLFTCHGRLYDALGADKVIELPARSGGARG